MELSAKVIIFLKYNFMIVLGRVELLKGINSTFNIIAVKYGLLILDRQIGKLYFLDTSDLGNIL